MPTLALCLLASALYAQSDLPLRVSDNGRFLVRQTDGSPFFLLGDTAWTLDHLLTREDISYYLDHRRKGGFNTILLSGIAEQGGDGPNVYGDSPFKDGDFTKPLVTPGSDPANKEQYDFWDHLDFFIEEAAKRKMYVALNPIYTAWYIKDGPRASTAGRFTLENAEQLGVFWGKRFGSRPNILWLMGGDLYADHHPDHKEIHTRFARGIARGASGGHEDYSKLLMTYHPGGQASSSRWWHDAPWLDFNMQQTGQRDDPLMDSIPADYALSPAKPALDGEAWYENLPLRIRDGNRVATDFDVRKRAYWAVFGGAFGHVYGELSVMLLYAPGVREYQGIERVHWKQALDAPGAAHMAHLRRLIESRPMLERVPDQTLINGDDWTFNDRIQATRGNSYLFVYSTAGNVIVLNTGSISGEKLKAWWFDPRTGHSKPIGTVPNTGIQRFHPPTKGIGQDWVLVLDDASKNYPAPGQEAKP